MTSINYFTRVRSRRFQFCLSVLKDLKDCMFKIKPVLKKDPDPGFSHEHLPEQEGNQRPL
jgi:hypothetical protein